ncbi:MAG: DUF4124 domain-containing protein, partial [bacterium]
TVRIAIAALALWSVAAVGQVYESKDKSGAPVFSDRPSEGSKAVDMPAPNVVGPQQGPAQAPPPPAPEFRYSRLGIVAPQQQGTIHSNTGAFDVQLSLAPDLRSGDAFVLTLDGNRLPNRYSSANIGLTAQDYAAAAADTHQHVLAAAVVDSSGKVMISANPVSFYVSRTTVREHRRAR